MKYLSITGPRNDIDRAIDTYLKKYEIQLENAMTEFKNVSHLHPVMEQNPYREYTTKAFTYASLLSDLNLHSDVEPTETVEAAAKCIQIVDEKMQALTSEKENLLHKINEINTYLSEIDKFSELDYDVNKIFSFKFMHCRFGKMTTEYYEKYIKFIDDEVDAIFCKCHSDNDYVWGVYFVPASQDDRVDAIFSSLHFERIRLASDIYGGTPEQAVHDLTNQKNEMSQKLTAIETEIDRFLEKNRTAILAAKMKLDQYTSNYEIHKFAAYIKKDEHEFFLLCGWMPEKEALMLQNELNEDTKLFCIFEDDPNQIGSQPPIKLKNPKIVKPFEMFTKMYGLPNYKEFDPTLLIAITYSLIFGIMFGDVGQGFLLVIGGALLYAKKKMNLAACISCCGVFSMIFGFLFGSIFGFEHVIEAVWLRPMKAMTTLPFIGQLNTVFVVAIAFGMFLILMSMILHIINYVRMKDKENAYFDANGGAGFVFYLAIIIEVILFMTGHTGFGIAVAIIMFGIPLLCIALKEPLGRLLKKETDIKPTGIGMFLVTTFFELFEVLLSYFSNTLSFVRIGAFAVSHAAMMEVVLMLAGAESGNTNWIVIVLGNIFVCALEGLIVGIQVLRLEYYELFSRYYKGDGKEFKPNLKQV